MPVKPSSNEEEYMFQQERDRRRRMAQESDMRMRGEESIRLKDLHWMRCPKCGMELMELEYRSTKIDQCSSCDGIWLDAGELKAIATEEGGGFMHSLQKLFKS